MSHFSPPIHSTGPAPDDQLLTTVRRLLPVRALTYYEHLTLAERQADRLHQLLGVHGPAADFGWLLARQDVTVVVTPRWQMRGVSGITQFSNHGWTIGVNKGEPHARRRFTLAHELKHWLDGTRDTITYQSISADQRERIADYFAACYLMPESWLRKAWKTGIQDPEALAGLFTVSLRAMQTRLTYLQFLDDQPDRPVASYFRRHSLHQQAFTTSDDYFGTDRAEAA